MYALCVGMQRSCSTWQYEVVSHLLGRHRDATCLGFLTGEQFAELGSDADENGWVILKSHRPHDAFTSALDEGRARGVYAYRDLRDVAYSLVHKLRVDFQELIERRRFLELVIENDQVWTTRKNLLVQRYESIIADPASAVEEIAGFLEINLGQGEAAEVAAEYSFEANRRRAEVLTDQLAAQGVNLADDRNALIFDPQTLLHWNHVRQGSAGGWRDESTPEERQALARICGAWLIERGYEPDESWSVFS